MQGFQHSFPTEHVLLLITEHQSDSDNCCCIVVVQVSLPVCSARLAIMCIQALLADFVSVS